MGFREHAALQVDGGTVVVDATDEHFNPHGSVHGGLIATMLDVAMGEAVAETGGESPVTVSLTVTYLEPGRPGRLEARATVRKRGKRLLVVEGEVVQDGDVVADALATFSVAPG
ncbi:MAG: thioesterase superfamily protein [Frankiales bacterium]|nr:thioesterase superfamily protein [Frankiales bacterium]